MGKIVKEIRKKENPILVTGSYRSGTTWVGKMLAFSPEVHYVHEPFNLDWRRRGICNIPLPYWYLFINASNEKLYEKGLIDLLHFRYNYMAELQDIRSLKDLLRMLRDSFQFLLARIHKKRLLMKDPIALLSAEWLHLRFQMDVVVMIRHPAAFVSSVLRKNWNFDFNNLLNQPALLEKYVAPYKKDIEKFSKNDYDLIEKGILIWNILHYVILQYKRQFSGWFFIRHEDISENPVTEFSRLYNALGLTFNQTIANKINEYSGSNNPIDIKGVGDSLKRNSRENIWNWKRRLSSQQIQKIKDATHEIAQNFYSNADW